MKKLSSVTISGGLTVDQATTLSGIVSVGGIGTGAYTSVLVRNSSNQMLYRTYSDFLNDISGSLNLSGYVPTSRTLTINGTTYDLTANRTWTITTPFVSKLQHTVKAGVAINKGQAVYVTGADGTNMVVGLASNASEATSSKTMGLLDATVSTNGFANVVTEGLLSGLNTSAAGTEGDPVWLGTGGNLIYGLTNKPYAPAHLVFIGIVTRKNANNGEIFVKVQNGFELKEIHDVDLITSAPTAGQLLRYNSDGLWKNWSPNYLTAEADTLASVTGRGATTNTSITVGPDLTVQADGGVNYTASRLWLNSHNNYRGAGVHMSGVGSTWFAGTPYTDFDGGYVIARTGTSNDVSSAQYSNALLTVKSTGNVGIGTSSPNYKLHVSGNAYINETLYVNQATTIEDTFTVKTQNGSYNVAVIDYSGTAGGRIKVYTDGILRSQIGSYYGDDTFFNAGYGGNVGIGTSSPSTKLNIYSDTTADGILVDILSRPRITLRDRGNSDTIIGTGDYGLDDFFIDTYSGNALAIKGSTRNVGIGTSSPNEKLHVAGNINAYVNGGIDAGLFASTSAGSTTIALRSNGITHFNGGSVGIGTVSPSSALEVIGAIRNKNASANSNYSQLSTTEATLTLSTYSINTVSYPANIIFSPASTEAMRINTAGKVSIGTTDTNSDKSDFTVYTGSGATIALTSDQVRMGGTDVNWGVAIRQNGAFETYGQSLILATSNGNYPVNVIPNGTTSAQFYTDYTYFPGLDFSISRVNGVHSSNYFRGDGSHLVIGTGGTLYLNYAHTSGSTYIFGTTYINNEQVATRAWVGAQGYLTSVSDIWVNTAGDTMTGTLSFAQPVGLAFANGQYIKDNNNGGLIIYSGAAVGITGTSIAVTGAATFSSTISVGSRLALQPSYFGYSSGYKTLLIGSAGTDYTTNAVSLAFNVDITGNPSGAFNGSGQEYIWRNAGVFITPNAANTTYNTLFSWNSSGQLTFNQATTLSSSLTVERIQINSSTYEPLAINSSYGQVGLKFGLNGTYFAAIGSATNVTGAYAGSETDLGLGTSGSATANITFATGASYLRRVTITAAGNVGIDTTAPTNKLQIGSVGSSGYGGNDIVIGNGTQVMAFYQSSTISTWYTNTNFALLASGGGSTGNLGIGTSSPSQKLHVVGNQYITGNITVGASGNYSNVNFIRNDGSGVGGIGWRSDGIFYVGGHIDYGPTAGNRVRVYGFGELLSLGNSQAGDILNITTSGTVGINTTAPIASLDNQGSAGTYRQRGITTLVTNTLGAVGEQAKRFEIARVTIDYNDWNSVGPIEIELYEKYFSQGLRKKYSVYYGYVSTSGVNLTEMTGVGQNNFQVTIGAEVVISGDLRYIPIYVDVRYYTYVTAILKTNRELSNSNPPEAGAIWLNNNPTGTNISNFTADNLVYVGNINGGNSTFSTGNLGIGTPTPTGKLDIVPTSQNAINISRAGGYASLYSSNDLVFETDSVFYFGVYTPRLFSVNGSFYTTVAGSVGIGTSTPGYKLDVQGSAGNITINTNGSLSAGGQFISGTGEFASSSSGTDLNFRAGATHLMVLKTSGNVGIGTVSPGHKLEVNGGATGNNIARFTTGGAGGGTRGLTMYSDNSQVKLQVTDNAGSLGTWAFLNLNPDGGHVGIGTTSPATPLHVNGGAAGTGGWNRTATLAATYPGLIFNSNGTKWGGMAYDYSAAMRFWVNANNDDIFAGTLALSILNNGNVGIGDTTPATKLVVDGVISATGGNSTNWNTAYSWGNHASASYATTSYVTTQINNLIAGAPGALDTLDELAAALGDDASFATTVTNSIAGKVSKSGDTMTSSGQQVLNIFHGAATGDFNDALFVKNTVSAQQVQIGMATTGSDGDHHRVSLRAYKGTQALEGVFGIALRQPGSAAHTQRLTLDYLGNLTIGGALTESSSIKLKENVETSEGNLEKVVNLRPVTYNKIGSQTTELGLIAEEVAAVYPEFVQYDENGEPIGVNYSRLTAALIGAVKELTNQVQELNKKING
jgi:hypothetical protein